MKNLLRYAMMAATVAMMATACGDKDDNGQNVPAPSPLTPDQHKAKLETIGKEFAGYFSPEESRTAIESLQTLLDLLNANDEVDPMPTPVQPMTRSLLDALRDNAPGALMGAVTRAAIRYTIAGELGSNGMIYTYNDTTEEWDSQASDERKITVNYADDKHESQVVIAYAAEKTDYTYKPENAIVEVPNRIALTLLVAKKEELSFFVIPNLSSDGLTLNPEAKLTHGTLTLSAKGEANPNYIACNSEIVKNGTVIATGYAKVAVSDLTDTNNWIVTETDWNGTEYEDVDPSDHFRDYVKTGEGTLQLLTAKVVGQGDIRKIIDLRDKIENKWTQAGAEAEAAIYNANMSIYLAYADDNTKVADIEMQAVRDYSYFDGTQYVYDYTTEGVLVFGDGSRTAFESYFTRNRFSSLFDTIEELLEGYSNILR
ncbi:MAG: hypothetical protein K2I32_00380 [Alistipes sp.]|nr:hypothetical protein [Alistipes sp.]